MIVGLGKTGLSCARYFQRHGIAFAVMDSEPFPAALPELQALAPDAQFMVTDEEALLEADEIVLSPGVPRENPEIRQALDAGVPVTGDVAMFAGLADAPLVAITGSNGKSTVTALVGEMARYCGVNAGVGGNIGVPCLDLLEQGFELYVIEISSYQLETAENLHAGVAALLNLSPDHMDRYPSVETYYATKARIYQGAGCAVVNREVDFDLDLAGVGRKLYFSPKAPVSDNDFGIVGEGDKAALYRGGQRLMGVNEIALKGSHNHLNALAALAIGSALEWDMPPMLKALRDFPGLPHRCETVATIGGVDYINDSKATNTGSTLAAVEGFSARAGHIILILGGIGKGADFSVLADSIVRNVRCIFIYGRDRNLIAGQLAGAAQMTLCETLDQVVETIGQTAQAGDLVLFSPACASQDQYRNFEARGEAFKALVTQGGER